jgi:hypothetical protein
MDNDFIKIKKLILKLIKNQFVKKINLLEKKCNNWHPGSNDQILYIIHPYLYCFNDKSTNKKGNEYNVYKWLPPSELYCDKKKRVKIKSYINNLDFIKYEKLYVIIEKIVEKIIPYFEKLLKNDFTNKNFQMIFKISNLILTPKNNIFNKGKWYYERIDKEKIIILEAFLNRGLLNGFENYKYLARIKIN